MNSRPADWLTWLAPMWFPLALLGLLILALPGMILLILYLLGLDGPINNWLRERWHFTYEVAIAPEHGWAIVLLLLLPVLLILLYFLKLKRKPLQVPSTFLWKKSIEDLHVNSLFQWLRENVLLLLQLLVILFLIYAIIRPRWHGREEMRDRFILLIDNSASMSATDIQPTRLEKAKEEALKEIDARRDTDYGMVIVFNSSAEILQSFTNDRNLLRRAVEGIGPTQRTTRIEEALSLAESLANPNRSADEAAPQPAAALEGTPTEVHIFSDGRFPDLPDFALANLNVVLHTVGEPGPQGRDNVGIVSFSAVRDDTDPGRLRVFLRVLNFRTAPVECRVEVEWTVNGERIDDPYREKLLLAACEVAPPLTPTPLPLGGERGKAEGAQPPGRDTPGEAVATFVLADIAEGANVVLHARLLDVSDKFALDDQAWLTIGLVRKAKVLVVGSPNPILHAFFDHPATEKIATTTYLSPAELGDEAKYGRPAREGYYDLVVFDRCAPAREEDLPLSNTFFIDAVPPPWKKEQMARLENPEIKGWMSKHPLLRYLTGLTEIGLTEAFRFDLKDPRVPPRTPRLIEAGKDVALLFTLDRQSFTDLVMTFPLINDKGEWTTNWPLQPRFPLFLRNVLYSLGNVSDSAGEDNVQPGEVKLLRPDVAVKEIEVIDPAGRTEVLKRGTRPVFAYGKTEQVGVYAVKWEGRLQRNFAVNLMDANESDLAPRRWVQIGQDRIAAEEAYMQPRDLWKWVVAAALLLLLLEWYIYNRRVYI
ncbi:MAG TPA: VWA domain-containing protein [Gemmataceae bacterium]|nr:VWA domain-containing protein [Gemmataceae bacterium]